MMMMMMMMMIKICSRRFIGNTTCEQSVHLCLRLHTKRHGIGGRHICGQNCRLASTFLGIFSYFERICDRWHIFILAASSET